MNKNIKLSISTIIMFITIIVMFLVSILSRQYYIGIYNNSSSINIVFIINIFILLICTLFNVYLLTNYEYPIKNTIIIIVVAISLYTLINFLFVPVINNSNNSKYYEMTEKLVSYCKNYHCDKYETKNLNEERDFVINKRYIDYNNEEQKIKIHTIYNNKEFTKIKAVIYSSKESYSSYLIKEQLTPYLFNFGIELDELKMNLAFEKRDNGVIKLNNQTYEVISIYEDNLLKGFETKIVIILSK